MDQVNYRVNIMKELESEVHIESTPQDLKKKNLNSDSDEDIDDAKIEELKADMMQHKGMIKID